MNWYRELKRWLVRPMTAGIALDVWPRTNICIVNYDRLKSHRAVIRGREWDLLICDESHMIKSMDAQRTQEVFGCRANLEKRRERVAPIPAQRRLYLTGTPILNKPFELWPILRSLGWQWTDFTFRYCGAKQTRYGWDVSGATNLAELQERLRSTIMVRRRKADVLTELPAKRRQIIELSANGASSQVQAELAMLRRLVASEEDYAEAALRLRRESLGAFGELSRLRHQTALAKVPAVIEHVLDASASSPKIILFGHHKDALSQIRSGLEREKLRCVGLTGDMDGADRQRSVDLFQADPSVRVFCGTIGAAGVGITLTASSHVVFAELDWVPGNICQAEDRAHRIGQRDSVLVQHLVFEGSLDAAMVQTLVRKQEVIEAALDAKAEEQAE